MKIKNKTKEIRKLIDNGNIVFVYQNSIIDCIKPVYDKNSFEEVNEKADLDIVKKKNKKMEANK